MSIFNILEMLFLIFELLIERIDVPTLTDRNKGQQSENLKDFKTTQQKQLKRLLQGQSNILTFFFTINLKHY